VVLSQELKDEIQTAYSTWLASHELKARYGQRLMIAEVAKTLGKIQLGSDDQRMGEPAICVVEAGTGTGKTIAYAVAALPIAKALGKKLVVATATVALQEQIVYRDFPDIQQRSGLDFKFSLAKGRSRYMCLSKLDGLLSADPGQAMSLALYPDEAAGSLLSNDAAEIYQAMLQALSEGDWKGDRDSWKEIIEDSVWRPITTDHAQCTGRRCAHVTQCAYFKARESLEEVDCVIANHDLVLADLALGGGAVLPAPEDAIYIFDEGHQLPDKAVNHFAHHQRVNNTRKWLEQSGKILANLGQEAGEAAYQREIDRIQPIIAELTALLNQLWIMFEDMLGPEGNAVETHNDGLRIRFSNGELPTAVMALAGQLHSLFSRFENGAARVANLLDDDLAGHNSIIAKDDAEIWYQAVGSIKMRAQSNLGLWLSYSTVDNKDEPPRARWITALTNTAGLDIEVSSTPIMASDMLSKNLWQRCCGAVVTSATLTALNTFDRYITRSGVPANSTFAVVPSPFDYNGAASLHVPDLGVEPTDADGHTSAIIDFVPGLLDSGEGTLVLFSSRRQMLGVYDELEPAVQSQVLLQDHHPKHVLLELHRQIINKGFPSIIFGLASFAEGIDLPGSYCSHVVIAKIPFSVPDDPVEAELADWIRRNGGNPFMEIAVPDAAIKLVQASGRLLRKESDTGRITLLDRRVVTKRYGQAILDSLPNYRREIA
jgi:ATP-dependent DNA helicase DinG